MKLLIKLALTLVLSISAITSTHATVIKLNDSIELGVLSLNESFEDFYGWDKKTWSAHTGYEQNNTLIMFFAEYKENLALFVINDKYKKKAGKKSGKATFSIANLSLFGNVILLDDSAEKLNGDSVNWNWNTNRTDGLVYQIKDAEDFNLDINISKTKGLKAYKFLSFDSNNKVNSHKLTKDTNVSATAVPEPTSIAILGLALFGLAAARRKA